MTRNSTMLEKTVPTLNVANSISFLWNALIVISSTVNCIFLSNLKVKKAMHALRAFLKSLINGHWNVHCVIKSYRIHATRIQTWHWRPTLRKDVRAKRNRFQSLRFRISVQSRIVQRKSWSRLCVIGAEKSFVSSIDWNLIMHVKGGILFWTHGLDGLSRLLPLHWRLSTGLRGVSPDLINFWWFRSVSGAPAQGSPNGSSSRGSLKNVKQAAQGATQTKRTRGPPADESACCLCWRQERQRQG